MKRTRIIEKPVMAVPIISDRERCELEQLVGMDGLQAAIDVEAYVDFQAREPV